MAEAYSAINKSLKTDLVTVAKHEVEWTAATYAKAMKMTPTLQLPSARLLESIVISRPFQGRILKDWSRQLEAGALHRIIQQINLGLVEGEGVTQIRRDGGAHRGEPRDQPGAQCGRPQNPRLFPHYRWISLLDARTSTICEARSGQVYDTGKGPLPPAHFNCRSTVAYAPRGTTLPEEQPYEDWLKKQPTEVQRDILGESRYALWKAGKLPLNWDAPLSPPNPSRRASITHVLGSPVRRK